MSKCITSICIYGPTGVGKTAQAEELAKWCRRTNPRSIVRVASLSSGWEVLDPAVETGLIVPTDIRARDNPFETIDRFSRGWWPSKPEDPTSPLVPPEKQEDWANVAGIFYDGLTEIPEWMMHRATMLEAKGTYKFSAEPVTSKFKDGETFYASPSKSDYGTIQNHITMCVSNSKQLLGKYIVWTALELRVVDDGSRLPMYGPDVIGKAKTSIAPAWFGKVLHLKINKDGSRSMWTNTHLADDGIPYAATVRTHVSASIPSELKGKDYGLVRLFELLEESKIKAKQNILKSIGEQNAI